MGGGRKIFDHQIEGDYKNIAEVLSDINAPYSKEIGNLLICEHTRI